MTDKHVRFIGMSSNIGWTQEAPHPEMSWRKIFLPYHFEFIFRKVFSWKWYILIVFGNSLKSLLDLKVKLAPCWRICREVFPFWLLRYVNNRSSSQVDYFHFATYSVALEFSLYDACTMLNQEAEFLEYRTGTENICSSTVLRGTAIFTSAEYEEYEGYESSYQRPCLWRRIFRSHQICDFRDGQAKAADSSYWKKANWNLQDQKHRF